ncbi:sulfate reduction electron transfer complex DsrMKJOP subunit DsrM [bacterium]|nr:sulfate reduction electron transfer complex DsrMKJOP subunit DsrM [bacterium]
MSTWSSLIAIVLLITIAIVGVQVAGLQMVFGVVIPYIAIALFLIGVVYRVIRWAMSPVPFRIPTTSGQARSLPWIKNNSLESPHNGFTTFLRMLLEVLLFRSLFRNTKTDLKEGRLLYGSNKWLWLGGIVFHYSFLVIFLRHFKYFAEPTPAFVTALQSVDGFFQIGLPILYITDMLFLAAVSFLFIRRVWSPQLRYLSLASDYFPLFLLLAIGCTGVLMRYFTKVDIVAVKELGTGLLSFHPVVPEVGVMFYIHLFLVSSLIAYFPFSKLMHMAGIFLSPTRNLANNNRTKRHVNPWDYPVHVHTYAEYEDEFRPVMKAAGLPLDKEE